MTQNSWTVPTQQDPDTGDLIITFPEDLLEAAGFSEGDILEWTDNGDGSYTMTKSTEKTQWVLVEALSQYRMRYLVEAPLGNTEYALDTVKQDKAKEFSQLHLGETTLTHRVVTEQEALELFRSEEDVFDVWDDESIKEVHFTYLKEDDTSDYSAMDWPSSEIAGP